MSTTSPTSSTTTCRRHRRRTCTASAASVVPAARVWPSRCPSPASAASWTILSASPGAAWRWPRCPAPPSAGPVSWSNWRRRCGQPWRTPGSKPGWKAASLTPPSWRRLLRWWRLLRPTTPSAWCSLRRSSWCRRSAGWSLTTKRSPTSPLAAPRSSAIRAAATSGAMAPVAVTAIPEVRASVGPASAATGDRAPTSEENAVARVAVMTAAEMIGALHGASRMATWPASSSAWERTKGCDRATWWVLSPTRHAWTAPISARSTSLPTSPSWRCPIETHAR